MLSLLLTLQAMSPQALPPPPVGECLGPPGPLIVFFDRNSAVLSEESRAILENWVNIEADPCGHARFTITGHIDRDERTGVDRRRAEAVRKYLATRGLRPLIGPVRGVGNSAPRIAHPPGVEELQNRRVVLESRGGRLE